MSPRTIVTIVQARMTSTRLPGKVLLPLAGAPALVRMIERVARARLPDSYLVATSSDASDDPIVATCEAYAIPVARGPLDDVLARFVAALPARADAVVRLTADCPLVDPELVDAHVARFLESDGVDMVSNAMNRTFPNGLDVEVASRQALLRAHREASSPFDREHVMPFVHRHGRSLAVTQDIDLSSLRWTLDTRDDHEVLGAVFAALHPERPDFTPRDVYELLLERPDLVRQDGAPDPVGARERILRHLSLTRSAA